MSAGASDVVVAGGGTGGHLYPGLALADELAARGLKVAFVGTASGIEARVVPAAGHPLRLIAGRQIRGAGLGRALGGGIAAALGVRQGFALLGELRPRLVVGVGGYASVALVVAAWLRRIPIVLLEQNVVPGAANRALARLARCICVGFAAAAPRLRGGRVVHTGNPVRADVLRARAAAPRTALGLLVVGGSAGARRLNAAMLEAAETLGPRARELAVTHQTGVAQLDAVRAGYAALGVAARVEAFITDMGSAYAATDIVVARAGAMTCAEVTAVGLPSVLVPYPSAADDHQRRNAEVLVAGGAAEMILDGDLTGERLATAVRRIAEDPDRRAAMAACARALGRPDAAARVAEVCLGLIEPRGP